MKITDYLWEDAAREALREGRGYTPIVRCPAPARPVLAFVPGAAWKLEPGRNVRLSP